MRVWDIRGCTGPAYQIPGWLLSLTVWVLHTKGHRTKVHHHVNSIFCSQRSWILLLKTNMKLVYIEKTDLLKLIATIEDVLMGNSHFWAHLCVCTVGSYASLSVCMSGCDLTKILTWPKVWWASMGNFLYMHVCLDVTWQIFKNKLLNCRLGLRNLNLYSFTWLCKLPGDVITTRANEVCGFPTCSCTCS